MGTAVWKHKHKISNKEISSLTYDCNRIKNELVEQVGQIFERTLYLGKERISIGADKISISI